MSKILQKLLSMSYLQPKLEKKKETHASHFLPLFPSPPNRIVHMLKPRQSSP